MATRTTVRKRIAFVPTEQVEMLLKELSELSGQSMASLASEMLHEVAPVIRGQLDAFRAIAATPEKAKQYVQDYANRAVIEIAQTALDFEPEPATPKKATKGAKRRASP